MRKTYSRTNAIALTEIITDVAIIDAIFGKCDSENYVKKIYNDVQTYIGEHELKKNISGVLLFSKSKFGYIYGNIDKILKIYFRSNTEYMVKASNEITILSKFDSFFVSTIVNRLITSIITNTKQYHNNTLNSFVDGIKDTGDYKFTLLMFNKALLIGNTDDAYEIMHQLAERQCDKILTKSVQHKVVFKNNLFKSKGLKNG